MKIAILGQSGMLGSMVFSYFFRNTDFRLLVTTRKSSTAVISNRVEYFLLDASESIENGLVDALNQCNYIINCIGLIKTHIRPGYIADTKKAIQVNSIFPHKLFSVLHNNGPKIIQIATDCVYSGVEGKYAEDAMHDAYDVYGKTKSLGEIDAENFLNLRCSIIGPEIKNKKSLLEWFVNQEHNAIVNGYMNHIWNGITTYHFAKVIHGIMKNNIWYDSTQHLIPADSVSKLQLLRMFADKYSRQDICIEETDDNISIDRSLTTIYPERNMNFWRNAGYQKLPTIVEMIREMPNRDYLQV